jgi:DNA-binding CsgD family transcriptional regulator
MITDTLTLPRVDPDSAVELLAAAAAIVDQLGDDLAGTDVSVALCDEFGRVIARAPSHPSSCANLDAHSIVPGSAWAPQGADTRAIGPANQRREAFAIHKAEHFIDAQATTTVACTPLVDIRTGRTLGSIALVSDAPSASQLLIPIARSAAREIERRAYEGRTERLLESQFLSARRRYRGPLAVVGQRTLLVNAAAAALLTAGKVADLWPLVRSAIAEGTLAIAGLSGADGALLDADLELVRDHGDIGGAILRFRPSNTDAGSRRSSQRRSLGWNSLTDAEHGLAEFVGLGMTNREIAAELFLSRHTVDSHLRHIFRKLDINSRVELARLVALARDGRPTGTATHPEGSTN